MTRSIRVWTVLCGLFVWLSMLVPHALADEPRRVVVLDFRGPSGGAVRNHVVAGLKKRDEVDVLSPSVLKGAERGAALREAASKAQVSAVIEGSVVKKGKLLKVSVSVRDASTGEVLTDESWTKKKPQLKTLRTGVWDALGTAIMRTPPPQKGAGKAGEREQEQPDAPDEPDEADEPEERAPREQREERKPVAVSEPEPERTAEPTPEPEEDETPSGAKGNPLHPALVVSFGPRMMWRYLHFETGVLSNYSSYASEGGSPAFNLALNALYFPGAHFRNDWLSDFGVQLDLDYSLLLKSSQAGKKLDTTAYEFGASLVYRLPLDVFELRGRVGYTKHVFEVDVPAETPLPAVDYSMVHVGVGGIVNIVRSFSLDAAFTGFVVLDSGEIATSAYSSDTSAWAWELGGGATLRFLDVFGVRAGVDYRRYNIDFGKDNNVSLVLPKNGTDSYLRATLSFVYTLPGK